MENIKKLKERIQRKLDEIKAICEQNNVTYLSMGVQKRGKSYHIDYNGTIKNGDINDIEAWDDGSGDGWFNNSRLRG